VLDQQRLALPQHGPAGRQDDLDQAVRHRDELDAGVRRARARALAGREVRQPGAQAGVRIVEQRE
jgi:hypothetical protein